MRHQIVHVVKGATLLAAAAFVSDLVTNVGLFGLDGPTSALATAVGTAIVSWLRDEASG